MRLRLLAPRMFPALLWMLSFPSFASAYIDPGNGSYLFQILLGLLLTVLFTLRNAWFKILSLFKGFLNRFLSR